MAIYEVTYTPKNRPETTKQKITAFDYESHHSGRVDFVNPDETHVGTFYDVESVIMITDQNKKEGEE